MSDETTAYRAGQIVVLIVVIGATIAANILGMRQGDVANGNFAATVFFFPADFVFGTIWPVIYLGVAALAVHQVLPSQVPNRRYQRGMWVLACNLVLNGAWIVIFNAELFVLSLLAIVPILATAVIAYRRLEIGRAPEAGLAERMLTIPVAIYVAWLTIATVANVSLVLANEGWGGWGLDYSTWGVLMLVVGTGLGGILLLVFRDPVIPAVYLYAYMGIMVRRLGEYQGIVIASIAGAAVFFALFVISLVSRHRAPAAPISE